MTNDPMDLLVGPEALAFFTESKMAGELDALYDEVPSGACEGSARCCSESVNMFYSEFINVVRTLHKQGTLAHYTQQALRYYLTELVVVGHCPLLTKEKRCSCYSARPLPCRIFGHLSQKEYESNYAAVLKENREAAEELLITEGIVVPAALTSEKIPFCTSFTSDTGVTTEQRDQMVDTLFGLESRFLAEELLEPEDFGLSLVQWFAYGLLGRDQASALRLAVSKEWSTNNSSPTLTSVLEECEALLCRIDL